MILVVLRNNSFRRQGALVPQSIWRIGLRVLVHHHLDHRRLPLLQITNRILILQVNGARQLSLIISTHQLLVQVDLRSPRRALVDGKVYRLRLDLVGRLFRAFGQHLKLVLRERAFVHQNRGDASRPVTAQNTCVAVGSAYQYQRSVVELLPI